MDLPRRRRRPARLVWTAVLLLIGLFAAACGGGQDAYKEFDGDEAAQMYESERAGATADVAADMAYDADMAYAEQPIPLPPIEPGAPTGRHVVRSAEIIIETTDTTAAFDDVLAIAERAGGYAATTDISRDEAGMVSGWVTLRVPSDRLDDVVRDIEDTGESVPRSRIDEYDVSMDVVDVEARLSNLRAFETELLALLREVREGDPSAEDLVTVFERIRSVRQEIDQLEARQTALRDQVSMATVHVGIQQKRTAADVSWTPSGTLADALEATARLLTNVADGVIWLVVTVLPIALTVLLLPALIVWIWWRRRRERADASSGPTDS